MTTHPTHSPDNVSYADEDHDTCFGVEDTSFWFRHRNECIASMVRRYPVDGVFYDVGGGNGYVARRLLDEGHDVVLVEPGQRGATNARLKRHIPRVICSTLSDAGVAKGSAAAVGVFDVIEHVEDDHGFIRELAEILKPGGMLFLTVPAYTWMWSDADVLAGHFRRYTKASIQKLVAPFFDIEFSSYFFSPLLLPIAVVRVLPYRLGLHRSTTAEVAHGTEGGLIVRAMERLLVRERHRLAHGTTLPTGASLIMAARRRR
ncbi:Methyltransferase domain-containing protein [Dyella jiangningensis]|uniref:class I SAM-dependent methyltransferase n=1 Tax=Dyella sp. AtDHG13 TaxID=1938897 RepID=UPI0008895C5A|nr:class I SAM-dependent methyltransferase [Dyella sp. AtDHG13]PXV61682.1 methyltransferase family protein [Dyella sp. AtDHG13]SDJ67389.1 Methyltransferase domain-containing protein [Dyella jiangningensis]